MASTNQSVTKYTLTNKSGAKVELISYGASIAGLWVPDKNGKLVDVVLGFDDFDGMYRHITCHTIIIGLRFLHSSILSYSLRFIHRLYFI